MTEQFRDCFVGEKGYDALKKLMKGGNEFCTELAKCLQERYNAEVAYVRALRKSSDTILKLAGKAKGSLSQAFTIIGSQTNVESEAHISVADTLLNQISMPMKNLADTQYKERKSIEDTLDGKFRIWKEEKDNDNKYRTRQFEKCREIETLNAKMNEISKSTKNSARDTAKESILSSPLVMGCVLPSGRHTSASEKSTSTSDARIQANMDISLRKADEELEKIERKYHAATKDVELAREACDAEMNRSCEQIQSMELNRITEMEKFVQLFVSSIQTLNDTMNNVSEELCTIRILPDDDIVVQARSNPQISETEILLYDIYAEQEQNTMGDQRRILSLMRWMEMLTKDIEIHGRSKNASFSSLPSAPVYKSVEEKSQDDDRSSSSDGAMYSASSHSQRDIVVNNNHHRDASSSSSNDDDGAMHRGKDKKREKKKKTEANEKSQDVSNVTKKFPSELFIDRQRVRLLQFLYEASLFKIEQAYNIIKRLPEPQYPYSQFLTRNFNDKGYPTTLLRIPYQSLTQTPPSAPSASAYFATAMPMYAAPPPSQQKQPLAYTVQRQAPTIGWALNSVQTECSAPDNRTMQPVASYPVLSSAMTQSTDYPQQKTAKLLRATHSYKARHPDELTIRPGDIIMLLESRQDDWCKGDLNGKVGLFPGNYVEDA